MQKDDVIHGINGPIVTVEKTMSFSMSEMVYVGPDQLVGEVISLNRDVTTIQVYEDTTGLKPGDSIQNSGVPMSILLAPGLLGNMFDGIGRPLKDIEKASGPFLPKGCKVPIFNQEKLWHIKISVSVGSEVSAGMIFGSCQETSIIEHFFMIPHGIDGIVEEITYKKEVTVNEKIIKVKTYNNQFIDLSMCQHWPIRTPRPIKVKKAPTEPLITGQRVVDTLFPIAKGGAAVVPGGFGAGKTMIQHQLAKWCDADIIIYVGCGERGNEMTQVIEEFEALIDPKSGKSMSERTIFIANTSNMPVAAREASIYTGVTLAEYYRDMGYNVALMADSTSRWAEALREISGRLEEMPAEEGFPAYLPSRISEFYERAGHVETLSGKMGSVSIIGAVSPQGADFSEPITQASKRFTRCFWALDKALAYARHYPAINWNSSYTEYFIDLDAWFIKNIGKDFVINRKRIIWILREEERLMEIVKLIGLDMLADDQRLIIEMAKLIKIGYLQQNAFHDYDSFVPIAKQHLMMKVILYLNDKITNLVVASIPISKVLESGLFEKISQIKYKIPNDKLDKFNNYISLITTEVEALMV
ncbi:MAG: V-type ATP synthase subunit A [Candidatus Improbicoccus devescovinae]|nr:MAG: V-type ATP synthase subunit A [Candidatus Improbicoccus devescovinae]